MGGWKDNIPQSDLPRVYILFEMGEKGIIIIAEIIWIKENILRQSERQRHSERQGEFGRD